MERKKSREQPAEILIEEEEPAPSAADEHSRLEQISGDKEVTRAPLGSRQRRPIRAKKVVGIQEGVAKVFRNFEEGLGKKLSEERQEFLRQQGHLPPKNT